MKKKEFLEILKPRIPKFYSFAYSMVPDELHARQLVVDAANVFFIKEKDFIQGIAREWSDKALSHHYNKEIVRGMMEHTYKLGIRRFQQLFTITESLKNKGAFYRELDASTRGILFLRHKLHLNFNDIKLITDLQKHQVIEKLYMGRRALENIQDMERIKHVDPFQGAQVESR